MHQKLMREETKKKPLVHLNSFSLFIARLAYYLLDLFSLGEFSSFLLINLLDK